MTTAAQKFQPAPLAGDKPKAAAAAAHYYEPIFHGQAGVDYDASVSSTVIPSTVISPTPATTTVTASADTPNSHHHDSDCGSSSGLGGTNNCSSDSSMLDSESRDSGGGSSAKPHRQLGATATLTPSGCGDTSVIPSTVIPPAPVSLPLPFDGTIGSWPLTPLAPPLPPPQIMAPLYCSRVPIPMTHELAAESLKAWVPPTVPPPPGQRSFYTLSSAAAVAAAAIAHGYQVSCGDGTWQGDEPSDDADHTGDADSQPLGGSGHAPVASTSSHHTSGEIPSGGGGAGEHDDTPPLVNGGTPSLPPGIAAQLMRGHDLFVHILPGDVISLAVGKEIQHIPGPATIRMVSPSAPPSAIPMSVPHGHVVHQLLDKNGMLRHIIMSKEGGLAPPAAVSATASCGPISPSQSQTSASGLRPDGGPSLRPAAGGSPLSVTSGGGGAPQLSPYAMPPPVSAFPPAAPPPPQKMVGYPPLFPPVMPPIGGEVLVDPTALHAFLGLHPQAHIPPPPAHPRKWVGPAKRGSAPSNQFVSAGYCNTTAPSHSKGDSNHYGIEDDERDRLCETLSSVQAPKLLRVGARDATIGWQELDTSEAAAPGGPFPQIDASEFVYDISVYDGTAPGRCIAQQRCASSSGAPSPSAAPAAGANNFYLTRLKPATDYLVNIRAALPERELCGNASPQTAFRTLACAPDPISSPKILQRQSATALTVGWCQPCANGAPILGYLMQIAKNKSEHFETVAETSQEYWRAAGLEPNAFYRLRVVTRNELGCSEPSAPLALSTALGPPPPPPTGGSRGVQLPYPHPHHIHQHLTYQQQIPPPATISQQQQQLVHQQQLAPMLLQQPQQQAIKPPTPTVLSLSARGVRLSWPLLNEFHTVTLEMCDFARSSPNTFSPIPEECYASSGTYASVNRLQSNREYRFRLSCTTASGETLLSDYVSVKTYKDRYENSALSYQSTAPGATTSSGYHHHQSLYSASNKEIRIPTPVQLQRIYDDERTVEISWRYSGRDYDNISFVVEASTAVHPGQVPHDDAAPSTAAAGASSQRRGAAWCVCYRGTATTAAVQDAYLSAFRVQAVNSRRQASSAWSDVLFVKRQKRQQQRLTQQQQQQSSPLNRHVGKSRPQPTQSQAAQSSAVETESQQSQAQLKETAPFSVQEQSKDVVEEPKKLAPPTCGAPKFSATTHESTRVTWRPLTSSDGSTRAAGESLLYELQRIDRQPPIIIYSGDESEHILSGLRPAEHLQTRVRTVFVDTDGRRIEGEWSAVGSACTLCAATTAPTNLRVALPQRVTTASSSFSSGEETSAESSPAHARRANGATPATGLSEVWLAWDAPAEINGSAVVRYVIRVSRYSIDPTAVVGEDEDATAESLDASTAPADAFSALVAADEQIGTVDGADASPTEFHVASLAPAQRYVFNVSAVNNIGVSPASEPLELFSAAGVPDAPRALRVESLSGALALSWSAARANGALITAYHIAIWRLNASTADGRHHHHHREPIGEFTVDADVNSFEVEELETEATYEVSVSAENSVGRGAREKVRCTTLAPPPEPPTLSVANATANALKLKWTAPKDSILYYQLEKENENGTFSRVYEGELHSAKIKGLKERSTHHFRIRAAAGRNRLVGAWSPTYEFATLRQPPPSLRNAPIISELASGVFQAEWQPVRCAALANSTEDDAATRSQLIYRLQIASKSVQLKTTPEPWRTAYEGAATSCTLSLDDGATAGTRQVRVLVVQKWYAFTESEMVEETISLPSPTAVFPSPVPSAVGASLMPAATGGDSADSSPKKRAKLGAAAANGMLNAGNTSVLSRPAPPPGATMPNKVSLYRRARRFLTWLKRTISDKDCALIVLAVFVVLAVAIAVCINQYFIR